MHIFQALRRSMKSDKDKTQSTIAPKSAIAIVPPKKVIRALYDYNANSSQELSFSRGDFFHVIGRENDPDWYEACNPAVPDARGIVPVAFFQALGKTERDSVSNTPPDTGRTSMPKSEYDSGYGESAPSSAGLGHQRQPRSMGGGKGSGAMVYGIVMYDFKAERGDELEAKAGEAIIVIAQSDPEWFVAKPIGRLGGPGLIPVSFIEIRDMASNTPVPNPQESIRKAGIPRVEEWKKMAADYKNSSISLGKFDTGSAPNSNQPTQLEQGIERLSLQQQQQQKQQERLSGHTTMSTATPPSQHDQAPVTSYGAKVTSQLIAPIEARIPRYCFADEKYWFVIEAVLEDGRRWELSRYYEDFYDFQIALLTEFPAEAGNVTNKKRTLPYMPGPVNYVTDAITEGRLHNLDAYVKNLLQQPPYISKCTLVKQFFAPREGDYEVDPNAEEDYQLSGGQEGSLEGQNGNGYGSTPRHISTGGPQAQPSHSSLSNGSSAMHGGAVSAMKIKVCFDNDLIALIVPTDIQFETLHSKIRERFKIAPHENMKMSYKDETTGDTPSLLNNSDLDTALERNDKLLIYVERV
ncbi:bud emergence protein 1 [Ceratocystis pirilliformis]|uniref:Bud emergence protein 1 n=1 Tax=Ceratocystis pirilliformis TaxID=259994 RepID=A0ABR3ZLA2_9PEZI